MGDNDTVVDDVDDDAASLVLMEEETVKPCATFKRVTAQARMNNSVTFIVLLGYSDRRWTIPMMLLLIQVSCCTTCGLIEMNREGVDDVRLKWWWMRK